MVRNNLISNSSFGNGTAGWSPLQGATLGGASGEAFYGRTFLSINRSALSGTGFITQDLIPVESGKPYAASGYFRVPRTAPAQRSSSVQLVITWYSGTLANPIRISDSVSDLNTLDPSREWTRISVIASSPSAALFSKVSLLVPMSSSGSALIYADAIMLEQSSQVLGYIDSLTRGNVKSTLDKALAPLPEKAGYILPLNADISIGGLVLNTIDENSVVWICNDIENWWSVPPSDMPAIARGSNDGNYQATGRYGARSITLTGAFLPPGPELISESRDKLIAALNLVRQGAWLVADENPAKAAFVKLVGEVEIDTVNPRGQTVFSAQLRSEDPIKYGWNHSNIEGITSLSVPGTTKNLTVPNAGTASVSAQFIITGPASPGSTIYNASTDQTITLTEHVRGAGLLGEVIRSQRFKSVVTLTTAEDHLLGVGDLVSISNVGSFYNIESAEVTSSSRVYPYTFSYSFPGIDVAEKDSGGSVSLISADNLVINTYNGTVIYNGSTSGRRDMLSTLSDWIMLSPGNNSIVYTDNLSAMDVTQKQISTGAAPLVDLTVNTPHYLRVGDKVTVALAETADLLRKEVTSNVATITTTQEHGFSVGDRITVSSTEIIDVTAKSATTSTLRIETGAPHGIAVGDQVTLALPTQTSITHKEVVGTVATFTVPGTTNSSGQSVSHGMSVGDSIQMSLPYQANMSSKTYGDGLITFTTEGQHGFSVGDRILMPFTSSGTLASVTRTPSSGLSMITNEVHNASVGDVIEYLPKNVYQAPTSISISGREIVLGVSSSTTGIVSGDRIRLKLRSTIQSGPITGVAVIAANNLVYLKIDISAVPSWALGVGDYIDVSFPGVGVNPKQSARVTGLNTVNGDVEVKLLVSLPISSNEVVTEVRIPLLEELSSSVPSLFAFDNGVILGTNSSKPNGTTEIPLSDVIDWVNVSATESSGRYRVTGTPTAKSIISTKVV